jgi:hypothetical protein
VLDISGTFRSTRETGSLAFSPLLSRGTEGSNPAPYSGESVSALHSAAVGGESCIFAAVCAGMGTREGTSWLRTRPFWPFFSNGRWRSPTLKASSIPRTRAGHGKAAACAC